MHSTYSPRSSSFNVDRTFGADGRWMTANVMNYVRSRQVVATLLQP